MQLTPDQNPNLTRHWLPSPFLKASLGFHAVAITAVTAYPSVWPWAVGAFCANHALISAAGLVPRCSLLGPNLVRLPAAAVARRQWALTIDDGPDPDVTPQVLDMLDRYQVKATFFCIGDRIKTYPGIAREMVRRGHAIENHSLRHLYRFSILGPDTMAREISVAQDVIGSVVGERPVFFRAPAGFRNPFLEPNLASMGLRLASWTRRGFDTVARDPNLVKRRLLRGFTAGDILLLHDGAAARTSDGVAVMLKVLPAILEAAAAAGLGAVRLRDAAS